MLVRITTYKTISCADINLRTEFRHLWRGTGLGRWVIWEMNLKMSCWSNRDAKTKIWVGCDSKACVLHFSGTQTRNERVILDPTFLTFLISSLINPLGSTSTVDTRFVYFPPLPLSIVTLSNKPSFSPQAQNSLLLHPPAPIFAL